SNVTDGSYEVVITGLADGQQPVVQRFPVALTEESNGGSEGDYPAYAPNTGYQAGDRVSNAGGNYECKPWPYSGWCGGSTSHYAPGTGSAWSDAWIKL
ncbi:MAG: immunoglobulin-like domain-containing protein, partial [Aeromonas veronii]